MTRLWIGDKGTQTEWKENVKNKLSVYQIIVRKKFTILLLKCLLSNCELDGLEMSSRCGTESYTKRNSINDLRK